VLSRIVLALLLGSLLLGGLRPPQAAASGNVTHAAGLLEEYWAANGGLTRFGLPLSPIISDPAAGGRLVQYYERVRLELLQEAGSAFVRMAPLGTQALDNRVERTAAPAPCTSDCWFYPETGHTVRGAFAQYWAAHGGITGLGLPLTEAMVETNPGDQREYLVQWFSYARLEYHSDYAGTPNAVLLGHLGREALAQRPDLAQAPAVALAELVVRPRVILLDPGHEPTTGGALGVEYRDTLRLAQAIAAQLTAAGYVLQLTRSDETVTLLDQPTLQPSANEPADSGYREGYVHASAILLPVPDLAISLHFNAAASGPGGGSATYYCSAGGPQNRVLAELVQHEIGAALADRGYIPPYSLALEDGTIGKEYGHLATLGNRAAVAGPPLGNRMVGLPVVLTEALFETNPTERALLGDEQTIVRLATGYVRAIDAYFATRP
jgi:N-acetylmuramoyl-L-alanine amidase